MDMAQKQDFQMLASLEICAFYFVGLWFGRYIDAIHRGLSISIIVRIRVNIMVRIRVLLGLGLLILFGLPLVYTHLVVLELLRDMIDFSILASLA